MNTKNQQAIRTVTHKPSKSRLWATWILTLLAAAAFLPSAAMKLTQQPIVLEGFAQMGISQAVIVPIGIVELLCFVLFLIPRTAFLGTMLLTGYLGGAVFANIVGHGDFIHVFVVGAIVWIIALLRIPEMAAINPFAPRKLYTGRDFRDAEPVAAVRSPAV